MEHTPPPRFGDWSAVNRHLTAGGTVEGIPRGNPYREYYLALHKKNMEKKETDRAFDVSKINKALDQVIKKIMDYNNYRASNECGTCGILHPFYCCPNRKHNTLCGKPHNNGEDTCNECVAIKDNDPAVVAQHEAWKAERDYNA